MHVKVNSRAFWSRDCDPRKTDTMISLDAPVPSPVITIKSADVEGRHDIEACRIEVESETGEFARYWVTVRIKHGRPKVYLTTKIGKSEERKQVCKSVQGTFNLL